MFTRCPQCQTAYRIHAEQLTAASGLVRCGKCANVFQSLDFLFDIPHSPYPALQSAEPAGAPPGAEPSFDELFASHAQQARPKGDNGEFFDRSIWEPYSSADTEGHAAARGIPEYTGQTGAEDTTDISAPAPAEQAPESEPRPEPEFQSLDDQATDTVADTQLSDELPDETFPDEIAESEFGESYVAAEVVAPDMPGASDEDTIGTEATDESEPGADEIAAESGELHALHASIEEMAAAAPEATATCTDEAGFEQAQSADEAEILDEEDSGWQEAAGASLEVSAEPQPDIEAPEETPEVPAAYETGKTSAEEPGSADDTGQETDAGNAEPVATPAAPDTPDEVETVVSADEFGFFEKTPEQADSIFVSPEDDKPANAWIYGEATAQEADVHVAAEDARTHPPDADEESPEEMQTQHLEDIESIVKDDDDIDAYLAESTTDESPLTPQKSDSEVIVLEEEQKPQTLQGFEQEAPLAASAGGAAALAQTAAEEGFVPEKAAKKRRSALATFTWTVGSLLLIAALFVQLVYFNRNDLARNNDLRPWLEQMCGYLDCRIPLREAITAIEIIDRDIRSNPDHAGQLAIDAIFVNNAAFAQPYPLVHITFNSIQGETIQAFTFTPEQYLAKNANVRNGMASGARVRLKSAIPDPGPEAVNYFFDFSHRPQLTN